MLVNFDKQEKLQLHKKQQYKSDDIWNLDERERRRLSTTTTTTTTMMITTTKTTTSPTARPTGASPETQKIIMFCMHCKQETFFTVRN